MLIVAVNHTTDKDRLARLPPEWEVWTTTQSSIDTYGDIAEYAVREGWGKETVVVQDDVRGSFPDADRPMVVYGTPGDHVCIRAFRASPQVWGELAYIWGLRVFQPCRAWLPLVNEHATILDTITHLEPVGSRGGGHRG